MRFSLFLLTVLLSACVSTVAMHVGDKTFPPRPDDHPIDVYLAVDAPVTVHKSIAFAKSFAQAPKNLVLVGRIDSSGAPLASWSSVVKSAQAKARQLGGDAILVSGWGSHVTGVDDYGTVYHSKDLSFKVYRHSGR